MQRTGDAFFLIYAATSYNFYLALILFSFRAGRLCGPKSVSYEAESDILHEACKTLLHPRFVTSTSPGTQKYNPPPVCHGCDTCMATQAPLPESTTAPGSIITIAPWPAPLPRQLNPQRRPFPPVYFLLPFSCVTHTSPSPSIPLVCHVIPPKELKVSGKKGHRARPAFQSSLFSWGMGNGAGHG